MATAAREERVRTAVVAGAVLLVVGLALVGIDQSAVGMGLTLGGLVVAIAGVHTFGRLGPA